MDTKSQKLAFRLTRIQRRSERSCSISITTTWDETPDGKGLDTPGRIAGMNVKYPTLMVSIPQRGRPAGVLADLRSLHRLEELSRRNQSAHTYGSDVCGALCTGVRLRRRRLGLCDCCGCYCGSSPQDEWLALLCEPLMAMGPPWLPWVEWPDAAVLRVSHLVSIAATACDKQSIPVELGASYRRNLYRTGQPRK